MPSNGIPLIPFDPREVGPFDVYRSWRASVGAFVSENATTLLILLAGLAAGAWHFGWSLPRVPNWMLVGVLAAAFASVWAWLLGTRLARALHTPDSVMLSVQDAITGDQRLVTVAPDRFEDMTIESENGDERERDYLHEVMINGRRAYEVSRYDREANVAVASWQAGVSNAEIRRDRSQIDYIKTSLERDADKALELLANHPSILREQASTVSNELIRVVEGIENPGGAKLYDEMRRLRDEADPSDELLGDDGQDDQGDGDLEQADEDVLTNGHATNGEASRGGADE